MHELLDVLRDALAARYGVQREVGRGGMATVFLADDLKHGRPVAIKVLHPELAASLGADRFLREIETAARLQHPHILPLYDSGSANRFLFYVMPFVDGESLRDRLNREKQLPLDDAVRIATQVASALAYAHVHGVVHRDIKPENIMLSAGTAVVADFGIARAVTAAGDQHLTETGTIIGTPAYMSPEQATGSADVDGRSDQYSLACVVYEMLVGHPPFLGTSVQEVLARHTLDSVSPPSVVREAIPDVVEEAILRALAKVPPDRYPTATMFAEALSRPPRGSGSRRRKWRRVRARPWDGWRGVAVIGGAALLVAAAAVVTRPLWTSAGRAPEGGLDPHRIAVLYLEDLSKPNALGYLADGLSEALMSELGSIDRLQVISSNGVAPYRHTSVPWDSVARALSVGSLITGSVEDVGDRVRVTVRLVDGASGADIERKAFEQPKDGVLRIRTELVQQATGFLRRRLGEEIRVREQRAGTESVAAWVEAQQAQKVKKDADSLANAGDMDGATRAFGRADSLLALAEANDARWVEPVVLRSLIAYRQSRLAGAPLLAAPLIDRGLAHAERALAREPKHARALEVRGSLRYWRWLLRLEPDPAGAAALFESAEQDLRSAVRLEPGLAGAWSTLSHLDYQKPDVVQAKLDAYRAYEADAYLAVADVIVWRLFTSSYDLEQFVDAKHWCNEGRRRFPSTVRFVQCQLWIMTSPIEPADVPLAWQLLDELRAVTPPQDWRLGRLEAQTVVAAVLARAGLADSARRLLLQSRGNADIDPTNELVINEAFVRTLLGDRDEALRLLRRLVAAQPERREELAKDSQWWFRELRSDPRYQELAGIRR